MSYHPRLLCQAKVAKDLVKACSKHRFCATLHYVIYYIVLCNRLHKTSEKRKFIPPFLANIEAGDRQIKYK